MPRNIAGKRVVLTGASSGIGRALAQELARAGAHVLAAGRCAERLEQLESTLSGNPFKIAVVPCDLTMPADREHLIDTAVKVLGGIDILINNAGVASWGHFANSDEAVMREVMEVNFFAPVELIRLALPHLTNGDSPAIVNVTSMCGRRAMPAWSEYSASKFALCGMSEALRAEMARFGIDVVLVVPGMTRSNLRAHMLRNEGKAKIDFEAGMTAEHVAAKIVKSIRNGKRSLVIGSDAKWMLRVHRWFPRLLDWLICRRVKKLYKRQQLEAQAVGK